MSYIEQNPHNGSSLCMQWAAGKASRKALLYNAISDAHRKAHKTMASDAKREKAPSQRPCKETLCISI